MPEITREEAKQAITEWLSEHVALRASVTGRGVNWDKYEAILRLALAALEDAERVEWLHAQRWLEISNNDHGTYLDADGVSTLRCDTFRAAIDRARGAVGDGA